MKLGLIKTTKTNEEFKSNGSWSNLKVFYEIKSEMTFTRPNLKKQKINNKTVKWENGDKKKKQNEEEKMV